MKKMKTLGQLKKKADSDECLININYENPKNNPLLKAK